MTATLVKPSLLIHEICVEKVGNLSLFRFSDRLQDRMESLLEKRKVEMLSTEEIPELESIGELDRTFTHMNAMLAAQNGDRIFINRYNKN
ncbi:hypothetical protein [Pseudanabaena sp. UWO310]|uniref:hypothetical protein n=1 Tax=Pseudanabaena sp. UWO310 TaxID=2480795 RepID=UPI0011582215|nr:hypothetical protein [Pseudanabaena sp. UWO310]TYQ27280.1 hypothetical protein PseudUWO310_15805 [Pseudanabaena sp. UWO310]